MLPDEVRKAMEAMDLRFTSSNEIPVERASIRDHEWAAIKAHLLAREAEVERLQNIADGNAELYQHELLRTERAEALLREALPYCDTFPDLLRDGGDELRSRITAHLSENSRG